MVYLHAPHRHPDDGIDRNEVSSSKKSWKKYRACKKSQDVINIAYQNDGKGESGPLR
jgi:hypothetical protein